MIACLLSCKPKKVEVTSKKLSPKSQKLDTTSTKNLSFKQFASKDGLPSSQIWNTYQDKYGYIWAATNDGVARFDGYNFHPYFNDLKRNIFLRKASGFFEDSDGEFWIISGEGYLNKFDRNNDKFIHIKTPLENGWSEQSPHQIYEDSLKNFWIGAYGGFQYYDRKKDTVLLYPIKKIRNEE
jgi:ligand-binding sensor domain-containing protein